MASGARRQGVASLGVISAEALDRALTVFWRNGYEGTSLSDLTEAMGINRPSLYAAFGNKESLFAQVVERYAAGPAAYLQRALAEPTARAVAEAIMYGAVEAVTGHGQHGCLLVQGALACSPAAEPARQAVAERRLAGEVLVRQRFERAQADGDLPGDADPADLARYVAAVTFGFAVQAAGGATEAELRRLVTTAMRGWPAE